MKKLKFSPLLFLGLCFACTHGGDDASTVGAPTTPSTLSVQIMSKVADQIYHRGNSSISYSKDGNFEYIVELDIQYFDPNKKTTEIARETDAICLIKIDGTVTHQDSTQGDKSSSHLNIASTTVLNSTSLHADASSVAVADVCSGFALEINKRKTFDQRLAEYDANHLVYLGLDFGVYGDKDWLYKSVLHETFLGFVGNDSMTRDFSPRDYFVVENSQFDVSSQVLSDLDGNYWTWGDSSDEIYMSLQVLAKQRQLIFTDKKCGLAYRTDIDAIYFDSENLKIKMRPTELTDYESPALTSNEYGCSDAKKAMSSLLNGPIELRYDFYSAPKGNLKTAMKFVFSKDLQIDSLYNPFDFWKK